MKQQPSTPLTESTFYILLSLSPSPKHGYAIMKEVKEIRSPVKTTSVL